MKFDFKVDKFVVALNIIERKLIDLEFENYLSKSFTKDYNKIINRDCDYLQDLFKLPIIKETLKYKDFDKIFKECKENSVRIKQNWGKYKQEIEEFLNIKCKTKLPDLDLTVYIVPWGGHSFVGSNSLIWGHKKGYKDKFYDLVYLYHEALHHLFKLNDISHCLIEKLTDNMLAKHFHPELINGYCGHKNLQELSKILEKYFNLYFNKNSNKFSNMNIFEFEEFLLNNFKNLEVCI